VAQPQRFERAKSAGLARSSNSDCESLERKQTNPEPRFRDGLSRPAHFRQTWTSGAILILMDVPAPQTFTALLAAAGTGESPAAKEALFAELYAELHRIARRELARSSGSVTLSPTTLLHEAYLSISARESAAFVDAPHFLAYAARAMRGLIIDHVRNRHAQKRGGQFELTSIETSDGAPAAAALRQLTQISDGLDALAKAEPALAELVDLKFFCGFAFTEIAAMRGVSERTILRQWEKARIFLHRSIRTDLSA
jgi:RNA polymerase sigma factor (TIGR02999 family)